MATQETYVPTLNHGLQVFFSRFVRASLRNPAQAFFFAATVVRQVLAMRRRERFARAGLDVPPIIIFSITNRCNLRCKGCFAQAIRTGTPDELSAVELRRIIDEADDIGVSFVIIAGGEPLTRPEIVDIVGAFPRIIFLLVTNGLLLDASLIARLKKQPNTIPVLSIEGNEAETDDRRGKGVHERLRKRMSELRHAGVFFSLSFTVNRMNFDTVTDSAFIEDAITAGCGFFLFLEYTPIRAGTEEWVITETQRRQMGDIVARFRRRFRAVFIAVPWDETDVGGCLAAGRGFVHISPEGNLEACPLAPFSDRSLRELPLRQALKSPLLALLRENHDTFDDTEGGCSLWKERERISEMAAAQRGAKR
ncbi:MAG TPA: radical SAM protein [Spirochaetia bacterium]|nr:radical SAM protein [Spirochaetia bacterium]